MLSLLLFVLPTWLTDLRKDKLIVFASLSYYGCDFDGDGRCDLSVWDPKTNTLYFQLSSNEKFYNKQFFEHSVSYEPVFADYDADGKTDFAFFHPDSGQWVINLTSSPTSPVKLFLGAVGDMPIPADMDGTRAFKPTIWRPNSSIWYVTETNEKGDLERRMVLEGSYQDSPFSADVDGDGKSDLSVWRPDDGYWHIVKSSVGLDFGQSDHIQHGQEWDVIVPNDYDGDGKCDLVFWRPQNQTWYFIYSSNNQRNQVKFGYKDDIPVSGDVDGDGIPELITWSPSKLSWNILNTKKQENFSYKWKVPNGALPAISILQKYE